MSALAGRLSKRPWVSPLPAAITVAMKNHKSDPRGFTLIELMVTISIAAILLAIGVPSFQAIIENNRLATQSNELITAVSLARSEAIKRGVDISITPNTLDYVNGWCVHTGVACNAGTELRQFPALRGMVIAVDTGNGTVVTFNGRGQKEAPGGVVTFSLQPTGCATGTTGRARMIEIVGTGRASVSTGNCA